MIALTLLRELGDQHQSDLPATLGVDATNVVALLNELEADGLVERHRSAKEQAQLYRLLSRATASPNCVEVINEGSGLHATE